MAESKSGNFTCLIKSYSENRPKSDGLPINGLVAVSECRRMKRTQEALSLPHRKVALQQEGANLIDDAGALADQSLAHPVQRLQVELIRGLGGNERHRWPLHRFGNRLRIPEVVLLSLRIGADVLRRHQPSIVTKCRKPATEMMRADAGLHADQARW